MTAELRLNAVDFVQDFKHKPEDIMYQWMEGKKEFRPLADLFADLEFADAHISICGGLTLVEQAASEALQEMLFETCHIRATVKAWEARSGLGKEELLNYLRQNVVWIWGDAGFLFPSSKEAGSGTQILSYYPPSAPQLFREVIQVTLATVGRGVVVSSRQRDIPVPLSYPLVQATIRTLLQA